MDIDLLLNNSGEITPFEWYNAQISLDFKVNFLANGRNIALVDHNGIVNGSYALLKHFDIKLNCNKVYDCNDANHALRLLILKIYLSTVRLMLKKQRLMNFSILIHKDQRKIGNLKLVLQIS